MLHPALPLDEKTLLLFGFLMDTIRGILLCSEMILLFNSELSGHTFKRKFLICKYLGMCRDFQPRILLAQHS